MKAKASRGPDASGTALKDAASRKGTRDPERHLLRLYVTGVTRQSRESIERVRSICEEQLAGQYDLEVVDIYQVPSLAKGAQIVATPTLIRVLPAPLRRYIGNMTRENILFGLELRKPR